MLLRGIAALAVAALVLLCGGLWWKGAFSLQAADVRRELSNYRLERMPAVPEEWWRALQARLDSAPSVSLLDPEAEEIVAELFRELPWIDAASVQVQRRMPEGFRVLFLPRQPDLLLTEGAALRAQLDADGTVIPPGLPEGELGALLCVPMDARMDLPAPGRRIADPLVHEALRAAPEAYALRRDFQLPIVRIERQPGYPADAPGVPPALSFVLADGRSIQWGRSEAAGATLTPPRAQKEARLAAVLARYPGLRGVQTLVLDRDHVRALDPQGAPLPLPEALP